MTPALRFLVTGTGGFVIDAAILTLLLATDMLGPASARCISFACALAATWLLNRSWSFGDRPKPRIGVELAGYVIVQVLGFLINYAVFLILVTGYFVVETPPVLALGVGSILSAVVTYSLLNMRLYQVPKHKLTPSSDIRIS